MVHLNFMMRLLKCQTLVTTLLFISSCFSANFFRDPTDCPPLKKSFRETPKKLHKPEKSDFEAPEL
jgi:hypothetical protein